MRKVTRRILSMVLAVMMVVSVLVITPKTDAEASMTIPSKVRCGVGFENYNTTTLDLGASGYRVDKYTVNNKRLHVKAVGKNTKSGTVRLAMYADRNGVYKISFYVKSKFGRKVGSKKTITVYAAGTGYVLRQVIIGNITTKDENLKTTVYTNQKKAKIYVKGLPGIKIKKITVSKYTTDGEWKTTTIKNGKVINIGTVGYSYFDEDSYDSKLYNKNEDIVAETCITVYYVDTFNKASYSKNEEYPSTSVWIHKKASKWAY